MRKRDLKVFPCNSRSQCRIPDGSSNKYLVEPRFVEEFLKTVEPKYNAAVETLRSGAVSGEAIYVISGFIGFVTSCSPAAMRLNRAWLEKFVESTTRQMDYMGKLSPVPDELGGETISSMLASGKVFVDVDPKYPQAIGISNILERTAAVGNSSWEILIARTSDRSFMTSDYPCAVQRSIGSPIFARIVPLAADIAIRIYPRRRVDRRLLESALQNDFPHFRYRRKNLGASEVGDVNRRIIRCAEMNVYSSVMNTSVRNFINKNRNFRTETVSTINSSEQGDLLFFQQREMPFNYD